MLFGTLINFLGSRYLKFKDKSILTAFKVALLYTVLTYIISIFSPALKFISFIFLLIFIRYFYKTDYKNAVYLWLFGILAVIVIALASIPVEFLIKMVIKN